MEKSELVLSVVTFTHRWAWKLLFYSDSSYCIQEKVYWIWQPHSFTQTSGSTGSMCSAVPCSAHHRIAFHCLHLNVFIAIECLLCFQIVLRNAVHLYNSYHHRMLMSTFLVSQFYTFVLLLQSICGITKWKKHVMVKNLKASGTVLKINTRSAGKTRNCVNFKQKFKIHRSRYIVRNSHERTPWKWSI